MVPRNSGCTGTVRHRPATTTVAKQGVYARNGKDEYDVWPVHRGCLRGSARRARSSLAAPRRETPRAKSRIIVGTTPPAPEAEIQSCRARLPPSAVSNPDDKRVSYGDQNPPTKHKGAIHPPEEHRPGPLLRGTIVNRTRYCSEK